VVRIAGATRAVGAGDVPTAAALIVDRLGMPDGVRYFDRLEDQGSSA
jgi:hypothetical protein